jgi:hypothetical protein
VSIQCPNPCHFARIRGVVRSPVARRDPGVAGTSCEKCTASNCLPAEDRGFESHQPLRGTPANRVLSCSPSRMVRLFLWTPKGHSRPAHAWSARKRVPLAGVSQAPALRYVCVRAECRGCGAVLQPLGPRTVEPAGGDRTIAAPISESESTCSVIIAAGVTPLPGQCLGRRQARGTSASRPWR